MSSSYIFKSAVELAELIRNGKATSTEVVEEHLAHIKKHNPSLNAVILLLEEEALKEAQIRDDEAKKGQFRSPLHGVPMTIKEQFWLKNTKSTLNSNHLKGWTAHEDALVVERLIEAGAIVLGKTNISKDMLDYQIDGDLYPVCVNPFNEAYSPGGSSGGSAAALASGMVPIELGGDLAGSVRIPPNFCGVYGLKTTENTIPAHGLVPKPETAKGYLYDMAVVGPMARTPEDLELLWKIIKGPDKTSPSIPPIEWKNPGDKKLEGYKIAWVDGWKGYETSKQSQQVISDFTALIKSQGGKIQQLKPKEDLHYRSIELHKRLSMLMIMQDLPWFVKPLMIKGLKNGFLKGMDNIAWKFKDTFSDYSRLVGQRMQIIEEWETYFEEFDLLVCPSGFGPAYKRCKIGTPITYGGKTVKYIDYVYPYNACFNASGHPAIAIPLGLDKEGLPVGVQVVGPYWSEPSLLHFAKLISKHTKEFIRPEGF
jgi:amidase